MLGALGDELIIPSCPGPQYYISPTHFHQHHSICYETLPIASTKTYVQAHNDHKSLTEIRSVCKGQKMGYLKPFYVAGEEERGGGKGADSQ